jgi:hypothetical protein
MANSEIEPPALSHAGYLRTNSRSHELPLRHHRTRADADAQLGAQQSAELAWHGTTKIRRWLNWCGAVGGSTTESSAGGSEAGGHSGRRRSRSSMARTRRPHGTRASAIHLCGPAAAIAVVDRWYTDCATASVLSHIDEHDDPIRASTSVIAKAYSSPRALSVGQTCTSKLPSAVTERA